MSGISATKANSYLNTLRNVADPGIPSVVLKMHTGDPGSGGNLFVSQDTAGGGLSTPVVWSAAASGSMQYASGGLFAAIAGLTAPATEVISHISLWSGASFLWSVALTTNKSISNGDSLQLTTLSLSFSPVAT